MSDFDPIAILSMPTEKTPVGPDDLEENEYRYSKRKVHCPIISADPAIQARYREMRADGQSHNMAEVLALRAFPGFVTDDTFMRGRRGNVDQFANAPDQGKLYHAIAEQAGVSTSGMYYCSPLASYPGDPTAWISGRSDVTRIAREKGLKIEGMVNFTPDVEHEPTPDIPIAEDILERHVQEHLAADPFARYEDVREATFNRLTGRDDPHPLLVDDYVPSPVEGVE